MKAKIHIQNFKSLKNVELQLKPNVFILGANGSGKSSLLKLILFIKRNLLEMDSQRWYNRWSDKTVIDYQVSDLIDLGSFKDIVYNNKIDEEIRVVLNCEFQSDEFLQLFGREWFTFDGLSGKYDVTINNLISLYNQQNFQDSLKLIEEKEEYIDYDYKELIKNFSMSLEFIVRRNKKTGSDEIEYKLVDLETNSFLEFKLDAEKGAKVLKENSGAIPTYTIPWLLYLFNNNELLKNQNLELQYILEYENIYAEETHKIFHRIQKKYLEMCSKFRDENEKFMGIDINEYSEKVLLGAFQLFKFFYVYPKILRKFFNCNHIPTIRELPRHNYLLTNGKFPSDQYYGMLDFFDNKIDASILSEIVNYDANERFSSIRDPEKIELIFNRYKALVGKNKSKNNDKLVKEFDKLLNKIYNDNEMGFFDSYSLFSHLQRLVLCKCVYYVKDQNNITGSICIEALNGSELNLAEASSGLMQVLPIIYSLLIGSLSSEINPAVIEQPELHLHPRLQAELAHSILTVVNPSIVETHSEHMIRKIQVLVAKGDVDKENVAIYFFDNKDGITKVKEMKMLENGFFSEPWPDGFFDDSYNLTKELLRASKN